MSGAGLLSGALIGAHTRLFVSRTAEIVISRYRNKPFATFKYAVGGSCYVAA